MEGHYILKLNNKCNMNCLFCADPSSIRHLPDNELNSILNGLKENRKRFDSLIITGGEPTIYKNLFRVLRYAKGICKYKRICLVTNGILLSYPAFLNKVIEEGVDSFQISYFALNKEKHDALSRTKNTFYYVNNGIKNAIKSGKEVRINVVINKLNYEDLPLIVEHLIKLKVNSITLAFMNPVGESVKNGKSILAVPFALVMPFIKRSFDKAKELYFRELYIENFPLCIARDYIDRISDLRKPEENKDYYTSGKAKTKKCSGCIYNDNCDGVWQGYLNQFGGKELQPIKLKADVLDKNSIKVLNDDVLKEKGFLFNKYLFEIAGMGLGIKKASVFYLKKNELPSYIEELKNRGYYCEVSDFSYLTKNEITEKIDGQKKEGDYSLYVSKDEEICKRLKYLDYYHQFKIREPNGIDSRDMFFEIGRILGYPRCCSEFLLSCHDNREYENLSAESNKAYQDETIYKILALIKSHNVLYNLNNFSISYPSFFNFFVCKYDCENASNLTNKLLGYIKEKYPWEHKILVKDLKMPIIFFSAHRIIYLKNAVKKDDRVYYIGCSVRNELLHNLSKEKTGEFKKRFMMFSEGDSFKMDNDNISIYKNDKIIHFIKKEHQNDGIFIEFT
jgi:MoaA/NifB/PqqE/SkfB family radical SAM enzyme